MKKYLMLAMLLMASLISVNAQDDTTDPDTKYATELLRPGTPAPDFEVALQDSVNKISLGKLRGHYVVLDFWASWCPDCRKDVAQVKELYADYYNRGVAFVGISFDTNESAWRNYIRKNEMGWLHYSELRKWKKETRIDRDYHVNWIPTYYIIDPDGKVLLATVVLDKVAVVLNKLFEEGFLEDSSAVLDKLLGK